MSRPIEAQYTFQAILSETPESRLWTESQPIESCSRCSGARLILPETQLDWLGHLSLNLNKDPLGDCSAADVYGRLPFSRLAIGA